MTVSYFTSQLLPGIQNISLQKVVSPLLPLPISFLFPAITESQTTFLKTPPFGLKEESFILFQRLLQYMELSLENINVCNILHESLMTAGEYLQFLANQKSQIFFLMGSEVVQQILPQEGKLSQIQGSKIKVTAQPKELIFIPLFHPDFIALNMNLKRMTWETLQQLKPWITSLKNL